MRDETIPALWDTCRLCGGPMLARIHDVLSDQFNHHFEAVESK